MLVGRASVEPLLLRASASTNGTEPEGPHLGKAREAPALRLPAPVALADAAGALWRGGGLAHGRPSPAQLAAVGQNSWSPARPECDVQDQECRASTTLAHQHPAQRAAASGLIAHALARFLRPEGRRAFGEGERTPRRKVGQKGCDPLVH
jgi:hypothetical protein